MRGLAIGILLVLASFTFPAASATGACQSVAAVSACAGDWGTYTGCYQEGEFSSENTGVAVFAPAVYVFAAGSHSCSNYCFPFLGCWRSEGEGILLQALAPGVFVYGGWTQSSYGQCHSYFGASTAAGSTYQSPGCPIGNPPDLPWGHVLP